MNYLKQIKSFWVAQDRHSFSAAESGLYLYLLETSNKLNWLNPFKRYNSKVMADLGIKSYKTLCKLRNRLHQEGIITVSTRNGDANVTYQLHDLCKKYIGYGRGEGEGYGRGEGEGYGRDNINETKPKPNITSEGKPSAPKTASGKKSEKKKNDSGAGAAENSTQYWQQLVEVWFAFNREHVKIDPVFRGSDPRDLKQIIEILKKRAEAAGHKWTEEQAISTLAIFLQHSFKDQWLSQHFLLGNLLKQFNTIIAPRDGKGNHKGRQSDLTGIKSELAAELGINPGQS